MSNTEVWNTNKFFSLGTYFPKKQHNTAALRRDTLRTNKIEEKLKAPVWSHNIRLNRKRIRNTEPISTLFGSWKNEKCLVVAAGPSTHKQIEEIRRLQEEGWKILAVDRIYQTLKDNGISPDLTIAVDSSDEVARFFNPPMIEETDKFAVCMSCHPFLYGSLQQGKIYTFAQVAPGSDYWRQTIRAQFGNKYYGLRVYSIVTFSAVDLAIWLGADTIALTGNDLSWESKEKIEGIYKDKGGAYTPFEHEGRYTILPFFTSTRIFSFFLEAHPSVEYINVSEGLDIKWQRKEITEL